MRVPHLFQTLFALGGHSQQQLCNGLATTIPTTSFTCISSYHRIHNSDVSSSTLLARKKPSSLEELEEGVDLKTPRVIWLEKCFGFNKEELKKIFAAPPMRTSKVSVLEERANWFKTRLSLKDAELRKMVLRFPYLLSYTIENNIEPSLNYYQERLGMNNATLAKTVRNFPVLMGYSIEDNVKPTLNWLQQRLNVTEVQLGKLITKAPSILYLSIEENLEPKIDWLQKRLNLDNAQIGKLVRKLPAVLLLSIDDNLNPKLNWIQSRLDVNDAQLSKITRTLPSILGFSISTLEPTLKWLQESLELDDAGLTKLIVTQPSLLSQNIDTNLEPTLIFYIDCIGESESKQLVTRIPALFAYSLEKRLKPRLEQAREAGLTIDVGCVQRIAMTTEEQWQTSLAFQARKILKKQLW